MNRTSIRIVFPITLAAVVLAGSPAARAEHYVHQPITLPRGEWAVGLGLGIGHRDPPGPPAAVNGLGFNFELRGGIASGVELGLRTGIRVGADGKSTQADRYGRTFQTETYGVDSDTVANPEVTLRVAVLRTDVVALALEGGVYLPIESNTRVGILLAAPLHFHLGDSVRFETGVYVPIEFYDPTRSVISFPFHLWFQVDTLLAIGALTGVRINNPGGNVTVPLGLGINYAASRDADLRVWFLFPNVKGSGETSTFGGGVGVEIRF
jgi:hypothetical protein